MSIASCNGAVSSKGLLALLVVAVLLSIPTTIPTLTQEALADSIVTLPPSSKLPGSRGHGWTSAVWTGTHAFVFGGNGGCPLSGDGYCKDIVRFDPNTGEVVTVAFLPEAGDGTSAVWDAADAPARGCTKGCAYVFGGTAGPNPGQGNRDIVRFNPETNLASRLLPQLPSPRHSTAAVWDPTDAPSRGCAIGCAYVFGGASTLAGPSGRYDEIVSFNPATGTVSLVGHLPIGLAYMTAFFDPRPDTGCPSGCAYVLGGHKGDGIGISTAIFRFDPATGTVSTMRAALPTDSAHAALGAVWDGGQAFTFGGCCPSAGGFSTKILRYDPKADAVTEMSTRLDTPRGHGSAVWTGRNAYLFGGLATTSSDPGHVATSQIDRYSLEPGAPALLQGFTKRRDGDGPLVPAIPEFLFADIPHHELPRFS